MRLIIGNKNYSSWSLRGWLPLKHLGIAFEEERIALFEPGYKQRILAYSPGGKVPCLIDGAVSVWESLAIGEMFRAAMLDRYGEEALPRHFRAFDTICSATQERQDAVLALLAEQSLDLMLVVGGYNSSNTCNLARICAERVRTFHVADPECLVSRDEVRHRPVGAPSTTIGREEVTRDWLPASGPLNVGLTAGASTPNNIVGHVIKQLDAFCQASAIEP